MRLSRLTALERDKIETELAEQREKIERYRAILADEGLVRDIVVEELTELGERYGDDRRTEITEEVGEFVREDLIADEPVVVCLSHEGYVKRVTTDTYRTQGRGGKGITGADPKEGDFLEHMFVASTHDTLLFFTDQGKLHWKKVYFLPEAGRTSRGRSIVNLLELDPGEKITSVIPVSAFEGGLYVFMATANGVVKKTPLADFSRPKRVSIIAIRLDPGDMLVGARLTTGSEEIILGTAHGLAIRFPEAGVRSMGRVARGVRGIRLGNGDRVVDLVIVEENGDLLTACEWGYGKRTSFREYRVQRRGGKGLINIRTRPRNGEVIALRTISDDDDLMMMTERGKIVRIPAHTVPVIGRATQGVRLITLSEGDRLVCAARVPREEHEEEGEAIPEGDGESGG